MGVHKLTAGDGYTYLTRQVATHDANDRGHTGLADYYSERGESPGRWWGAGLSALGLTEASEVTETQMRNLFGEGRHPRAEDLEDAALDAGADVPAAKRASQLGRPFAIYRGNAPGFLQRLATAFSQWNLDRGRSWRTPVPDRVRHRIRTDLTDEAFAEQHHRAPLDDRERSGFLTTACRQKTTAVAGYDLTFTPVKSVSVLWALGTGLVARQVEEAHQAAVTRTLEWLEREALYTRRGRGGVQQVPAAGLIAARFTHRDSRASDPHLHTHVAVSNKVQDERGVWLAVDGRVLYKANVSLSEKYNSLLEAELAVRLGIRFSPRDDPATGTGRARQAVREIDGIDPRLSRAWSRRGAAIDARRGELAASFQAEHGRPPTPGEAVGLGKQAWSQTRQAKHAPRSEAEQRSTWRTEAAAVLGSSAAVDAMVARAVGHGAPAPRLTHAWTDAWTAETAAAVVDAVQQHRATWQVWHLRAEAERQVRDAGIGPSDLEPAVADIVKTATEHHCVALSDPDPLADAQRAEARGARIPTPLTRHDPDRGAVGVYSLRGAQLYTSQPVLQAERRILAAAQHHDGRRINTVRVATAIAAAAAGGVELNTAQRALVRELATSGRRVQLALAPAGTGKTTALQVLASAWRDSGGTVLGLAPSAVAAEHLGASLNAVSPSAAAADGTPAPPTTPVEPPTPIRADTLAKLVWHLNHDDPPEWARSISSDTLVLIDEAGMAATTDLADVIDYVTGRGGTVRLIGDDRQLASIAAGGVLRDIAHQAGTVTLSEVRRFLAEDGTLNVAEAAATLALRDGDHAALAFYADHGRIHVGDLGACADQAYQAWAADQFRGADALLLASSREVVAELNNRARHDRLTRTAALATAAPAPGGTTTRSAATGPAAVTLGDGTAASVGDPVITRRNDRTLATSATDWVKNGDRWRVTASHRDGSLTVRHLSRRTQIRLPAAYVAAHVQLGYATTIHGAQGTTVTHCHVVLTGEEDRNLLYVALSRGRITNHLYLAVSGDGDPHGVVRPENVSPPTAMDQLAQILDRDGSAVSATTARRRLVDPAGLLHDAAERYHDAVGYAAEHVVGTTEMNRLTERAASLVDGLVDSAAWPTLRAHLALAAVDGHDPSVLLTQVVTQGSLAESRDVAAVLDARLRTRLDQLRPEQPARHLSTAPLPWLPGIPTRLTTDQDWGPYLLARHQQIRDHLDLVAADASGWTGRTAPRWARPFLSVEDGDLRGRLAVWRAVHAIPDTELRPTGEPQLGAAGAQQATLDDAARAARPSYPFAQRNWFRALPEHVRADPWIIDLCRHLARVERAGLPVRDHLARVLDGINHDASKGEHASVEHRPLPDQHQAAALWWRLIPHLGPAALEANPDTADLLAPAWQPALTQLVGEARANFLSRTPAWPTMVAAVDEACQRHDWTPHAVLHAAFIDLPTSRLRTGAEVCDALVMRIATLTDPPEPSESATLPTTADKTTRERKTEPRRGDIPPHIDTAHLDGAPPETRDQLQVDDRSAAAAWRSLTRDPHAVDLDGRTRATTPAMPAPLDGTSISRNRIRDLNAAALAFYESHYPASWAAPYMRERLRTDLRDHPSLTAGYAPPGPRNLLTHLTSHGASLDELEQAGLIRIREHTHRDPDYVDVFRDRLVMPIRDATDPTGAAVLGFVGRRNPRRSDDDYAGPKYLNTKTTTAYTKGDVLFGCAEYQAELHSGALAVLAEGPLDAFAITLATNGAAVGLAPLGTAITAHQVHSLLRHVNLHDGRRRIVVATDGDPAGQRSAHAAFWHLTAAGYDPGHIALPAGSDPASLYLHHGASALADLFRTPPPLGDVIIERLIRNADLGPLSGSRSRVVAQCADILAARGPDTWAEPLAHLEQLLCLSPGLLQYQIVTASIARDEDIVGFTRQRLTELLRSDSATRNRKTATAVAPQVRGFSNSDRATKEPEFRRSSGPSR